uniref:Uncharacterized protein n=1 Tax=Arundo donax TaxID=35708 RepID=A0A0A9HHT8_ARUDO
MRIHPPSHSGLSSSQIRMHPDTYPIDPYAASPGTMPPSEPICAILSASSNVEKTTSGSILLNNVSLHFPL